MGLRDLFRKDPENQVDKAEGLLADGEARKALRLALDVAGSNHPGGVTERARDLAGRARVRLVDQSLDRAAAAEQSEYWEDAVEWLETALQDAGDDPGRADIQARLDEARSRSLEEERPSWEAGGSTPTSESEPVLTSDDYYEALAGMLREDLAARYRDRPRAFRDAVLALNEGRSALAGAALDALVDRDRDDPVLRLERARARMAEGQWEEAASDLEAAWKTLGDEPLDLAESTSVPGLWAQVKLQLNAPGDVVKRLGDMTEPTARRRDLLLPFGRALREAGQGDEARSFLALAAQAVPEDPSLSFELASVLADQGAIPQAIDVLESSIAPSCSTGSCRRPPRHLPSFRTLADFYLASASNLPRVKELLQLVIEEQQGRATREDLELLAKFHEGVGDVKGAEEARAGMRALGSAREGN